MVGKIPITGGRGGCILTSGPALTGLYNHTLGLSAGGGFRGSKFSRSHRAQIKRQITGPTLMLAETKVGSSSASLIPCNHVPHSPRANSLSLSPPGPAVGATGVSLRGEDPVIIWPTTDVAGSILSVSNGPGIIRISVGQIPAGREPCLCQPGASSLPPVPKLPGNGGSPQPLPSLRLPDLSWLSHGADVQVLMLPVCKNAKKLLSQTQ